MAYGDTFRLPEESVQSNHVGQMLNDSYSYFRNDMGFLVHSTKLKVASIQQEWRLGGTLAVLVDGI